MNVNVPVVALSVVGILIAAAGIFVQQSVFLMAAGVGTILFAWLLQEMTKRRSRSRRSALAGGGDADGAGVARSDRPGVADRAR